SGLLTDPLVAGAVYALLCLLLAARVLAVPLIPLYGPLVSRVPVLMRVGVCVAATYAFGTLVAPRIGPQSLTTLALAVLAALVFCALLLPARAPGRSARLPVALALAVPPFAADCSGLSDCSYGAKIGLALLGIVVIALAIVLLPELVAGPGQPAPALVAAEPI